jgi:hypothetical protein
VLDLHCCCCCCRHIAAVLLCHCGARCWHQFKLTSPRCAGSNLCLCKTATASNHNKSIEGLSLYRKWSKLS